MPTARRTFLATGLAGALAIGGVTAAIAADPAPDGPPAIAFLANGRVAADALAAGPIAGQLGAPIYTTEQDELSPEAAAALDAGDPELVIVLGGTVAISDTVVDQVEAATGLTETDAPTPDGGIIRAAGENRFATASAVATLLAAYDPAYLPVGNQAVDADTLDGRDSTDFATSSELPQFWLEQAGSGGVITQNNSQEALVELTVTAPGDGYVNLEGFVYMLQRDVGDPAVNLRLWLDGELLVNSSVDLADTNGNPRNATFTVPAVFPVEAGQTYTVSMTAVAFGTDDLDIAYSQQQLEAEFWPASRATVVTS